MMGLVYLPICTYIYHNKIQSNATIHAGKYTNPNGIVRIFPLFNNEPLRPTSCSTLPGEGGIFLSMTFVCVIFFKGKQYTVDIFEMIHLIWSFCVLEISGFFDQSWQWTKNSASLLCVRCSDADLAQYLRRGSFLEQCNILVMSWCPVTPLLRFFCRVYFRSPGPLVWWSHPSEENMIKDVSVLIGIDG